jgi:type II secretory pathway predicted ATPase ExeA
MTEPTLDHLDPQLHSTLALDASDRIAYVRSDRWLDYPRGALALRKLADLVSFPRCSRMPSLLIWGESGMGKTMIAKTHLSDHPPVFDSKAGVRRTPVLSIQMPSTPDSRGIYAAILEALGAPLLSGGGRTDIAILEPRTLHLMKEVGVRMLMIDEFHNLLVGSNRIQRTVLNLVRHISNHLEISIVCLGTQEAREALMSDPQLVRRFESFELKPWKKGDDFYALLNTLLYTLPLRRRSSLGAKSYDLVLARTSGITSNIFRLMTELAVEAINSGHEEITLPSIRDSEIISLPLNLAA